MTETLSPAPTAPPSPPTFTEGGLLLRSRPAEDRRGAEQLHRGWHRGELIRLARGMYCPVQAWCALPAWDRFTLTVAAAAAVRPSLVLTGRTAAHLHGLPLLDVPPAVEERAFGPGHRARRPAVRLPLAPTALAAQVPSPPSRRCVLPRWDNDDAGPVPVDVALSDGTVVGTAWADALETVHLHLASTLPLRESVVPLDRLAHTRPADVAAWARTNAEVPTHDAGRRRFARACAFLDGRAESPGESVSRVIMEELGFAPPLLQHEVFSADGRFLGRVDFFWPEAGVAGEFDGLTKYDLTLHASEAERRRAIREERNREARLLRRLNGVARWTWDDLRRPAQLEAELVRHGVPRR
ncbi:hypothetical protein [Micrococcus sp.]|uniref:hypothetical protein n=1 Tax=Micrococcus sp. TaxID=1271 RepID=UPI002A918A1E|nr:hypothetical protein [Micrococcus sp.]MDY6055870.1 hypothetical protein [Micrococcus sp.]